MSGKTGVLLVNLGTPDAPTPEAVRRYLAEFLVDRRVVDLPKLLWWPILYGIVLRTRPAKSAEAYAQVWTDKGSPLAAITAEQANKLRERLGDAATVVHAMRYGRPSVASGLQALRDAGCERVLIAPLYPQYSGATNASAADKIGEALAAMQWRPELQVLAPYYDSEAYISALAKDLSAQLTALPFAPEVLLLSFHGLPQRAVDRGDPYYAHCLETARLLEEAMARPGLRFVTSFQSRFGRAKWIEPATDKVLEEEAKAGTKRLAIAAPGFAADCLETLEELAIRGREQFLDAGGEQFAVLSCLNASEPGMDMLETLVRRELAGWL
jgi:protoporphyrin/coproporphyrin ferrochelatase